MVYLNEGLVRLLARLVLQSFQNNVTIQYNLYLLALLVQVVQLLSRSYRLEQRVQSALHKTFIVQAVLMSAIGALVVGARLIDDSLSVGKDQC